MRITEFIDPRGIKLQAKVSDQNDAIDQLIALHESAGNLKDVAGFKKAIGSCSNNLSRRSGLQST